MPGIDQKPLMPLTVASATHMSSLYYAKLRFHLAETQGDLCSCHLYSLAKAAKRTIPSLLQLVNIVHALKFNLKGFEVEQTRLVVLGF